MAEQQGEGNFPYSLFMNLHIFIHVQGKLTAERAGGRQTRKGRGGRPAAWWEGGGTES